MSVVVTTNTLTMDTVSDTHATAINIRFGVYWEGVTSAGDTFLLETSDGEIIAQGTAPYDGFDGFYPFTGQVDDLVLTTLDSGTIRILKYPNP